MAFLKKILLVSLICFSLMFLLVFDADAEFSAEVIKQLDSLIDEEMEDLNLPGVVVAVWVPDEGEYFCAKGSANLKTDLARDLDSPFRIASITKTFTAIAVLQLIDEGKLKRSDKLSRFFPDFPNADKITIRDLLRMRSGIADFADEGFLKKAYTNPLMNFTAADAIALSKDRAAEFIEPDRETHYCNLNYILLGEIVKDITGNDIGVQITESILKPLGMKNTIYAVGNDLGGKLRGYSWNNNKNSFDDMTVLNPIWAGAAGAIISNIYDLKIFAKEIYEGSLLSEASQRGHLVALQMKDVPIGIRYGEGIGNMGQFWGHNGTIFGFSSEMWYFPKKDAVIIINVNRLDLDDKSKSSNLFFKITKILFPQEVTW